MFGSLALVASGVVLGWFVLPQPAWARDAARMLGLIKD